MESARLQQCGEEEREVEAGREFLREDLFRRADPLTGRSETGRRFTVGDTQFKDGVVGAFHRQQYVVATFPLVSVQRGRPPAFAAQLRNPVEQGG